MKSLKNLANLRKMIPQNYFPVFARVRIQAPHVFPKGPNLEKNQDLEIFKRATHQTPIFCREFWRSGLKISSEIEIFKRDWKFQAILNFFKIWALSETPGRTLSALAGSRSRGLFSDSSGVPGPKGPGDPCAGRACQSLGREHSWIFSSETRKRTNVGGT